VSGHLGIYGVEPQGAPFVAPAFAAGDAVRVRMADPPGHLRTPRYCRGKVGRVERLCGAFPNPEELAYNRHGLPAQPLYRVRFASIDLWHDYGESPGDEVDIEIYQHWLEPA
jgi:nitrile hydratase